MSLLICLRFIVARPFLRVLLLDYDRRSNCLRLAVIRHFNLTMQHDLNRENVFASRSPEFKVPAIAKR